MSNKRNWIIPAIEPLGDRVLPACLTSFSGGLLTVGCNADNDGIYMKSDASGRIYLNGVAIPGNPTVSNTSRISVAGGAGDDKINLSGIQNWNGKATIVGGTGNDILTDAPGRSDSLYGGNDNDILTAGFGNDTLNGGAGTDRIAEVFNTNFRLSNGTMVGLGTDLLSSIEQASLTGGAGDNTINATAFAGSVTIKGAEGNDLLVGGSNHDVLIGGGGDDRILGNDGNDTFTGGLGFANTLEGGNGIDRLVETRAGGMNLFNNQFQGEGYARLDGIERAFLKTTGPGNTINAANFTLGPVTLVGASGRDFLTGTINSDSLVGGAGNDVLTNGGGSDTVDGGDGEDVVIASAAGSNVNEEISLFDGTMLVWRGTSQLRSIEGARLEGGNADDFLETFDSTVPVTMSGSFGNDILKGDAGDDRLAGGPGNDTLFGLAGTDTLQGDLGNDSLVGGEGVDLFEEFRNTGDMILSDTSFSVGSESDVIDSIESARLSRTSNNAARIDASAFSGPTTLFGAGGNDTLIGGSAADSILGGDGNDSLVGNAGDDFFDGGFGTDTGIGGPGTDTFISVENQTQ